ncbi:GNAT family N-acetyltransferase [Microbacterium laevaniformans]|uniref:GNAT family N-acetyltransferase n=1 Tax=Microbacterium laevaniformans TaxID=36807 RepID=UPI0022B22CD5|nr:GNAT family N-acetyltransferase [Microbacterium laevaniformans]
MSSSSAAFHFAERAGIDANVLRDVLDAGPMASVVSRGKAQKLTDDDLAAQAAIADVLKNARLAETAADAAGSAHPLITASRELYESAVADGRGELDMIGVIAVLQARADARAPGPWTLELTPFDDSDADRLRQGQRQELDARYGSGDHEPGAAPSVRGSGVASAVLRKLEEHARPLGARRLVLETGTAQPDAIRFYQREGYAPIPLFGSYAGSDVLVRFGRDLLVPR